MAVWQSGSLGGMGVYIAPLEILIRKPLYQFIYILVAFRNNLYPLFVLVKCHFYLTL